MIRSTRQISSPTCSKKNANRRKRSYVAAAATMTLLAASFAEAQTFSGTWTSTAGTGQWGTAGNWSGGTIASGQAGLADFSTLALPSDQTVVLNTARTIGVLRFGDANATPTFNWTVSNGGTAANTLTLQGTDYANAGRPVINVVNGTTTISANIIQGTTGGQTSQWVKSGNGALIITGTIAGATGNGFGGLAIQGGTASSPSTVTYNSPTMNYGSIDNTGSNFFGYKNTSIATASGENGVWNIQAGTISTAFLQIGANGGNGFGNGTVNVSGGRLRTAGVITSDNSGSSATLNVSGGELAVVTNNGTAGFVRAGGFNNRPTTLTLSGSGRVSFYSDTGATPLTNLGGSGGWNLNGGGTSFINLNGGTLSIPRFTWTAPGGGQGGGNGSMLFNGGILQTTAASANFLLTGTISTSVSTGGALIDTNGNAVTIGNNLAHDPLLGSTLDGGLTKSGAGVLTLTGASGYTGPTTASVGTLRITDNVISSTAFNAAAGATLEFNMTSGTRTQRATSITGSGTVVKSGAGQLVFTNTPVVVAMSPGGLIDVQAGNLQASNFDTSTPDWSNNKGNLNIAAGATFDGLLANPVVAGLTGAGTYQGGWFFTRSLSVGANDASSTFDGVIRNNNAGGSAASIVNLIKIGNGAFTLTGSNTFTGGLTVNGGTVASASTVNINPTGTFAIGGPLNMSSASGAVTVLNQSGGVINAAGGQIGQAGPATVNLTGTATWNVSASLFLAGNSNGAATLNISDASQINVLSNTRLLMGQFFGRPTVINQNGGQVAFYSDFGTTLGGTGGLVINGGSSTYNLNGGTLATPAVLWTAPSGGQGGGSGTLNWNGGTLLTAASSSDFLVNGNLTVNVLAGGAKINTNGNDVTIANAILHAGSGTDGGLVKSGTGTLTLTGVNTYDGGTTVNAGLLKIPAQTAIGSGPLTVNGGGAATLAASLPTAFVVPGLSVAATGTLDIANNALVVNYTGSSPAAALNTSLATGGIIGTGATPAAGRIGFAEASDILGPSGGTFGGVTVDGTALLFRQTFAGDTNLDLSVDTVDFNRLIAGFGSPAQIWSGGDFTGDAVVDSTDFNLLVANFGSIAAPAPLPASAPGALVPEPASLSMLGAGCLLAMKRRRK